MNKNRYAVPEENVTMLIMFVYVHLVNLQIYKKRNIAHSVAALRSGVCL